MSSSLDSLGVPVEQPDTISAQGNDRADDAWDLVNLFPAHDAETGDHASSEITSSLEEARVALATWDKRVDHLELLLAQAKLKRDAALVQVQKVETRER